MSGWPRIFVRKGDFLTVKFLDVRDLFFVMVNKIFWYSAGFDRSICFEG